MKNEEKFAEIIEKQNKCQKLEVELSKLSKTIDKSKIEVKNAFIPLINEIYKNWRPKVGELVMCIDIYNLTAEEQIVASIDGETVRVRETPSSGMRFELEIKKNEYFGVDFIIADEALQELEKKTKMKYERYKLRFTKKEILGQKFL